MFGNIDLMLDHSYVDCKLGHINKRSFIKNNTIYLHFLGVSFPAPPKFFYTSKKILNPKIPFNHLIKTTDITPPKLLSEVKIYYRKSTSGSQNILRKSTSENQNILLEVEFQKSIYYF